MLYVCVPCQKGSWHTDPVQQCVSLNNRHGTSHRGKPVGRLSANLQRRGTFFSTACCMQCKVDFYLLAKPPMEEPKQPRSHPMKGTATAMLPHHRQLGLAIRSTDNTTAAGACPSMALQFLSSALLTFPVLLLHPAAPNLSHYQPATRSQSHPKPTTIKLLHYRMDCSPSRQVRSNRHCLEHHDAKGFIRTYPGRLLLGL